LGAFPSLRHDHRIRPSRSKSRRLRLFAGFLRGFPRTLPGIVPTQVILDRYLRFEDEEWVSSPTYVPTQNLVLPTSDFQGFDVMLHALSPSRRSRLPPLPPQLHSKLHLQAPTCSYMRTAVTFTILQRRIGTCSLRSILRPILHTPFQGEDGLKVNAGLSKIVFKVESESGRFHLSGPFCDSRNPRIQATKNPDDGKQANQNRPCVSTRPRQELKQDVW
jgi:hypothetical protein